MKLNLIAVSIFLAVSMPLAAESLDGYLIDKMCSAKVAAEGVDAARTHTKDCALMPNCKGSGYGIVTDDGKFLKFDKDGDDMAVKFLGVEDRKDNLKINVIGSVKDDSIAVIAIQLAL